MQAAALELDALGCLPFAGFCSDPCDGRTQGTTGMMDTSPTATTPLCLRLQRFQRLFIVQSCRAGGLTAGEGGHAVGERGWRGR